MNFDDRKEAKDSDSHSNDMEILAPRVPSGWRWLHGWLLVAGDYSSAGPAGPDPLITE